ncbi:MAG: lytic transglycosylase domain-containing protein [Alphaproteobacteria bacterium]|nr:lytic transglycosylase domain-containing protein [Alphaproteobacteria bacterium]
MTTSATDRDKLRRAFAAVDAGRWDEAHAAAAGHALGAKVIRWFDIQRPGASYGFDALAQFIDENPDWPALDAIRRRAEEQIAAVGDDRRVRDWFADRKPLSSSGALRLAEALDRGGDKSRANALAREIWGTMALSERQEQDLLQRFGGVIGVRERWARLDRMLWERRFVEAQRLLPLVEPGRRLLAEARMRLAREAADAPDGVAKVPAEFARDPGLAFERARFNRRQGFDDAALAIHRQAGVELGRPDVWWREREAIVRRLLREGRDRDAYDLVRRHGTRPEHGQAHAEALFLTGWIALRRLNDATAALPNFQALFEAARFPVTQARGAYWAGRASEAAGDAASAHEWYLRATRYDVTFYGQVALLRLADDLRPPIAGVATLTSEERAQFERSEIVRAAKLLADLEEHDRVKHFVRRLVDIAETPAHHRAAAQLAIGLGRPDLAVSAAKRSAQRAGVMLADEGWPTIRLPEGERPEAALVLATIRQESAFEADAVSHAGARGLMQLMPATAKMVAGKLGRSDHSLPRLVTDPGYNMLLGRTYLAGLLDDYNGSHFLALAAYNAGPGRAAQWIRDNGDPRSTNVDPIDWVELISIEETRNYVQRVTENLHVYRRKLGSRTWFAQMEREFQSRGR